MHPWRRTSGGWDPIPGTLTNIKDALDVYRAYRVLYYPKTFHITNSRYERYACTTISCCVHIANIVIVSDFHIEITYWQYWCTATGAYRYQRGEFLEVICLKKIDIRRYVCSDTNPTIGTKSARDMVDTHLIADTSKDSYRFISVHVVTHRSADHIDPTAYISCPYHAK